MPLIFETPNYAASRDRIGHWTLQDRLSGKSVYLQGDDARQFSRDIAKLPARQLDLAIGDYCEAMQ